MMSTLFRRSPQREAATICFPSTLAGDRANEVRVAKMGESSNERTDTD
jgi:hypothetical protein